MATEASAAERRRLMRELASRHPGFREAVRADAEVTALHRGERHQFSSGAGAALQALRLAWVSDAFAGLVLYRLKAALQRRGVPVLPRILHRLAMIHSQVSIGDPVLVHPGVYVVHGQIVIDGLVEVGRGAVISPWVTIGLRAGNVQGATIEQGVSIGTGAKIVGPVHVGAGASIGANAVVVDDVPAGETVAGVPAQPIPH